MPRKRERFERTDVPRNNPLRPYIAIGVIAVVVIVTIITVTTLWRKANQMNGLNDTALNDALYEQKSTKDPTDGADWSEDDFSNVALFIVDDIHADEPQLQAAQILVRDMDNPRATLVNLPLNTKMLANDSNVMLSTYYHDAGPEACLPAFTDAASIHVSHVIIASDRIWDQLELLKGSVVPVLLGPLTDELETINSDYHTTELIALGDWLRELGFENIAHLDAPYFDEQFEDGTAVANIDTRQLNLDVGIFVQPEPAPEPEPEPAPEEGGEEWSEGEYYDEYYESW